MTGEPVIRWMIRRDLEAVLEIEQAAFEFAWSQEDFLTCLRQRNCIGMVTERAGVIVGFMVYELLKDTLRIVNFGVEPARWREGVGSAMVGKLKGKLSQQRRTMLQVEVRESNLSAQLFFRAAGFVATEVLHDFYQDIAEDAYRMVYRREWDGETCEMLETAEAAS